MKRSFERYKRMFSPVLGTGRGNLRACKNVKSWFFNRLDFCPWYSRVRVFSSCWPTRGHIGRFIRNSNQDITSSSGGDKGCLDHRFHAPPAYTTQLDDFLWSSRIRVDLLLYESIPTDKWEHTAGGLRNIWTGIANSASTQNQQPV